jgi:RecB family exonuclease
VFANNTTQGEVIAHILNGVINRPARDAMLLHHALMDLIEPPAPSAKVTASSSASTKHERQQRFELLISRLVRLHWERAHFARVKAEYEEKYGRVVEEDLEEATKGDFREFCIALCQMGR